jgi:hypothetical protein
MSRKGRVDRIEEVVERGIPGAEVHGDDGQVVFAREGGGGRHPGRSWSRSPTRWARRPDGKDHAKPPVLGQGVAGIGHGLARAGAALAVGAPFDGGDDGVPVAAGRAAHRHWRRRTHRVAAASGAARAPARRRCRWGGWPRSAHPGGGDMGSPVPRRAARRGGRWPPSPPGPGAARGFPPGRACGHGPAAGRARAARALAAIPSEASHGARSAISGAMRAAMVMSMGAVQSRERNGRMTSGGGHGKSGGRAARQRA